MASLVTTLRYLAALDFVLTSDIAFRYQKRDRDLALLFNYAGTAGHTAEVVGTGVTGTLVDGLELDVSTLPNGVYTIKITNTGSIDFLEVHAKSIESR